MIPGGADRRVDVGVGEMVQLADLQIRETDRRDVEEGEHPDARAGQHPLAHALEGPCAGAAAVDPGGHAGRARDVVGARAEVGGAGEAVRVQIDQAGQHQAVADVVDGVAVRREPRRDLGDQPISHPHVERARESGARIHDRPAAQ